MINRRQSSNKITTCHRHEIFDRKKQSWLQYIKKKKTKKWRTQHSLQWESAIHYILCTKITVSRRERGTTNSNSTKIKYAPVHSNFIMYLSLCSSFQVRCISRRSSLSSSSPTLALDLSPVFSILRNQSGIKRKTQISRERTMRWCDY